MLQNRRNGVEGRFLSPLSMFYWKITEIKKYPLNDYSRSFELETPTTTKNMNLKDTYRFCECFSCLLLVIVGISTRFTVLFIHWKWKRLVVYVFVCSLFVKIIPIPVIWNFLWFVCIPKSSKLVSRSWTYFQRCISNKASERRLVSCTFIQLPQHLESKVKVFLFLGFKNWLFEILFEKNLQIIFEKWVLTRS